MATIDADGGNAAPCSSEPFGESTIVRQMVELVDAMPDDDAESASAVREITACMRLLSHAWPSMAGSTDVSGRDRTPSVVGDLDAANETSLAGTRFDIRRMLGHGGFGVVLLAFDKRLEREVALKVPRPEILVSRNPRQRFLREAQAAAALDHPNIVPVYDTGEIGPIWFITSRYVAGPTLSEWLRQQSSPPSSKQAAELIAVLADAVHHAHSRGVLHRDLKPANVLLETNEAPSNGRLPFAPRLSDFGLAQRLDEDQQLTRNESLIGTPRYMAPEQAACRHNDVGIQSDVYGLGVMLYELLTGNPPHSGDTDVETLRQIMDEPVPLAPLQQRRVPRDLKTICLKCLQKDSSQRYETASALAGDLRRFLAEEPITARPVTHMERFVHWCRRRPVQAALCAALCFVTVAGVVGITWQWWRAEQGLALAKVESTRAEENLRQLELAFIDLAWVFDEAELWSATDEVFPALLGEKLRRYADEMSPQHLQAQQVPKPIAAALYAMNAKNSSLSGQTEAADQNYRKSIELWREVLRDDPHRSDVSRAFAITLFGYAGHLVKAGKVPGDVQDFDLVRQMFETLKLPALDELRGLETYAYLMVSLGHSHARRGRNEEAIKSHQLAHQIWHELVQRSPNASFRAMEAAALTTLAAREHRLVRDFSGALKKAQQARRLLEEALQSEPKQLEWQFLLAATLHDEASYSYRVEGSSSAIPLYERSVHVYREALKDQPHNSRQRERERYGDVSLELAQFLLDTRGPAEALPYFDACARTWDDLLSAGALSKVNGGHLAMVYADIGEINDRLGQTVNAITAFRRSIALATSFRKTSRAKRNATNALIQSNSQLGDLLHRDGQDAEAVQCLRQSVDVLRAQTTLRPNNLELKEQLKAAEAKIATIEQGIATESDR